MIFFSFLLRGNQNLRLFLCVFLIAIREIRSVNVSMGYLNSVLNSSGQVFADDVPVGCGGLSQNGKFSYGYASSPGKRSSMEDFYETLIDGVDGEIVGLFGVFDGHGGARAAEYVKHNLFRNLISHPKLADKTQKLLYDHIRLVLEWPYSFCSKPSVNCQKDPLPSNFIIHGFWPVMKHGTPMMNCGEQDIQWVFEHLKSLFEGMKVHWPNLLTNNQSVAAQVPFWNYQWNKHGTCCKAQFGGNAASYFFKAIGMKKQVRLLAFLEAKQVKPGAEYELAQFQEALKEHFKNNEFAISCICIKGRLFLNEIHLCYSPQHFNVIPCNDVERHSLHHTCPKSTKIYFPAAKVQY